MLAPRFCWLSAPLDLGWQADFFWSAHVHDERWGSVEKCIALRCDVFSAFVIKVGHLCFVTSQVLTLSLKQWGWYLSIVQSTRVAGFLFDSSGLSWTDTCHQYPGPKKLLKRLLWRRPSLCLHFHLTTLKTVYNHILKAHLHYLNERQTTNQTYKLALVN